MDSPQNQEPYILGYRREDDEESQRLNSQHRIIQSAIMDGRLIHDSIPLNEVRGSIADLCCGTGVWLDDVATLFASRDAEYSPMLVGFDINTHAFKEDITLGIQLIEHDCTKPFDTKYIGKFDLVNMRGLAYAVPEESFHSLAENAVQLLRPGGYLQWLETESRLWKAYPDTKEISKALESITNERHRRNLVAYLPHYMLRQLLSLTLEPNISQFWSCGDRILIKNFSLMPGGICKNSALEDTALNASFSDTLLETMKLLLKGASLRGQSIDQQEIGDRDDNSEIQKLMDNINDIRVGGKVIMGGFFPLLIAQRSTHP